MTLLSTFALAVSALASFAVPPTLLVSPPQSRSRRLSVCPRSPSLLGHPTSHPNDPVETHCSDTTQRLAKTCFLHVLHTKPIPSPKGAADLTQVGHFPSLYTAAPSAVPNLMLPCTWSSQTKTEKLPHSLSYSPYPVDQQALWTGLLFFGISTIGALSHISRMSVFLGTSRNSFLITVVTHISPLFSCVNYT